jgi:hypothetical protein
MLVAVVAVDLHQEHEDLVGLVVAAQGDLQMPRQALLELHQ